MKLELCGPQLSDFVALRGAHVLYQPDIFPEIGAHHLWGTSRLEGEGGWLSAQKKWWSEVKTMKLWLW